MRISDWSSDVCSSDLVRRAVAEDIMVEPGPPRPTLAVGQLADRVHRQHQRRERKTVLPLPEPVIDENIQRAVRSHLKIGRASGRARVCKYVSIPGVADTLKKQRSQKKKSNITT